MRTHFSCTVLLLGLLPLIGNPGAAGGEPLTLHPVPLAVQSPRLLGMSMDDDGDIWFGSTHRKLYRYTPRSGAVKEIQLPFDASTSQTLCVGNKVYLLGQSYPRLMIYDRVARIFSEAAFPTAQPDVWYGTEAVDGKYLYLFDRGDAGIIKWDTTTDSGTTIRYPYPTPMPFAGRYVAEDQALWCGVWDFTGGQYVPLGIARLDLTADQFTEWHPFPADDADHRSFTHPRTTLFYPHTLQGKLVPFDLRERRWCKPLAVPEFSRRFGFIGLGSTYDGRWLFSISTYNGTATGCDGQPYHFCNALLEFDPQTKQFAFPTLEADDAYYQISYHLSAGGEFFATGNDIRQPDGSLDGAKQGSALFWQTQPVENETAESRAAESVK